jgi:hypothetical protein
MLTLGSANYLDLSGLPGRRSSEPLRIDDPRRVKKDIGITEAAEAVFPFLVSGVRFWPFLLVARDYVEKGITDKALQRLRGICGRQGLGRVGPTARASFRAYVSMCRRLRDEGVGTPLERFIFDRRRDYRGDPVTWNLESTWKKVFIQSLGPSAKSFAGILRDVEKRDAADSDADIGNVERAIGIVLSDRRWREDGRLWKAAACYAFLRCMYGVNTIDGIRAHIKSEEWAARLRTALLCNPPVEGERLRRYLGPIRSAELGAPPWGKLARSLLADGRRVLADLRFHTFHSLYMRPTPRALAR